MVHGAHRATACSTGDEVEVKHSNEYAAENDERVDDDRAPACATADRLTMLAASVNGALGRAGLMLALVAAVFGALSTVYGIRRHDSARRARRRRCTRGCAWRGACSPS